VAALKVTELGDYLREQRQHAKMSLRQLAEQAGVSNPYLSQIERGLRKPSAEVLQQIAKGLRISAEALYVRAGILEERGDRVEVEAAILADPHLSERQRRVLLDIYESFRAENERDADTQVASPASPSESSPSEPGTTGTKSARKRASTPSKSAGSKPAKSAAGESEPRKSARKAAKRAARSVAGRATSAQRRAAKKSTTDSDSQSQGGN
jgi:transcriptional regulator with XRE-family HTH domain